MRLRRHDPEPASIESNREDPIWQQRWRRVEEALEVLPVGVVVVESDGSAFVANRRATAPLGDLTGDTLAEVALRRALARARAGDQAEETVDIAGMPPRRVEITAAPLAAGGAVAVIVDASERLRLDAVRRDFVANVNHELRTPIGALTVLAEALTGERDAATVERLAGRIAAEAARARALIDDLLDFARVEAVRQPLHEPVDLAEAVEIAAARTAPRAERRDITVRVQTVPVTVDGDREQLIVAVANLIDNAVKYSEDGASVEVQVIATDDAAEVVVRDRGIGIPARDLDRIFERFYRVDQARDRRTGGTGLGLAIVRHVATNHGGQILVESQEGTGSTFTLRLPRKTGS